MAEIQQYFVLFEQAQTLFRAHQNEDAYIAFLKASRVLYELAKGTDAVEVRAKWLERAERVRRLAEKIGEGNAKIKARPPLPASR